MIQIPSNNVSLDSDDTAMGLFGMGYAGSEGSYQDRALYKFKHSMSYIIS